MKQRLFSVACALSLLLCVFCAWAAMSYFSIWRHGVVVHGGNMYQVVHEGSDLNDAIAYGLAAILFAILPGYGAAVSMRRRWRKLREQQALAYRRCASCGYDLRASPDRCPECGTPVQKKAQATT